MGISIFDIFKVGIGPSSSHTMGPMQAAQMFGEEVSAAAGEGVARVQVGLFGSLALTGRGHCSDRAILLGLEGNTPARIDPDCMESSLARIRGSQRLRLARMHEIDFEESRDLIFRMDEFLPRHPNGMRFSAFDAAGGKLLEREYYSVGGGFVIGGDDDGEAADSDGDVVLPYAFESAADLLAMAQGVDGGIPGLVLENERVWRGDGEIDEAIRGIWEVMQDCVERGLRAEGVLPGSLQVPRRAASLHRDLVTQAAAGGRDAMAWVNAFALAVNEENAGGGKVVTAPTNGAAGIVPAVLCYYRDFVPGADWDGVKRFFLTAGAIGILYKKNASLSGAEMGCQGEVGVACSMAAGALTAARGGKDAQIENAAEIGMEHNLGLTCDPVAGLVQIPCIERNAMGAVKAINAARLALHGDGWHVVSLDQVIATMRQTGLDMSSSYKETSQGGLAVNVIEC